MSQDLMQRTYQSFSLPLYALIHDSIVQAMQQAQLSKQDTVNLLQAIPKLLLSSKEQNELENAKGAIELEDSFGSGNFFVVDAGSQEAFVFTDQQNADHVNRLLNKQSGQQTKQSQQGQQSDQQSTKIQAESVQVQTASNARTQIQENQGTDTDLLVKMMMLQHNQPSQQQIMQQVALLDLIKEKDATELFKLMQISQIMNQFNQPQQNKENPSAYAQKQKDKQQSNSQQGQQQPLDIIQMLQELQLMNVLQRQK